MYTDVYMVKSDESGQQLNYTEPASTRLSSQTYERFAQYTEQEDVGKAEGLRRLIRSGLDHELETDEEEPEQTDNSLGDALLAIGVVLSAGVTAGYVTGGGNPDTWAAYVAFGMVAAGLFLRTRNHD